MALDQKSQSNFTLYQERGSKKLVKLDEEITVKYEHVQVLSSGQTTKHTDSFTLSGEDDGLRVKTGRSLFGGCNVLDLKALKRLKEEVEEYIVAAEKGLESGENP